MGKRQIRNVLPVIKEGKKKQSELKLIIFLFLAHCDSSMGSIILQYCHLFL